MRVGEQVAQQRRVDLRALADDGLRGVVGDGVEEGGGEERRGEGEQVQRDEEGFVEGAGDEEDSLWERGGCGSVRARGRVEKDRR